MIAYRQHDSCVFMKIFEDYSILVIDRKTPHLFQFSFQLMYSQRRVMWIGGKRRNALFHLSLYIR